jgi:hypothetical protein
LPHMHDYKRKKGRIQEVVCLAQTLSSIGSFFELRFQDFLDKNLRMFPIV